MEGNNITTNSTENIFFTATVTSPAENYTTESTTEKGGESPTTTKSKETTMGKESAEPDSAMLSCIPAFLLILISTIITLCSF